ncbi:hypothetical protein ACH3XW_29505 [Acanthocheilonema viteae]
MGDKIFDEMEVCFDNLKACQESCPGWQCLRADFCNGLSNKYVCLPIDSRFLSWILLVSFLIVLSCCSMLILCYTCWFLQVRTRHPILTNYETTFQNRMPLRTSAHV